MSDWPIVTLSEIAAIGAGNSAPQDPKLFRDGTIPFIRTSDVGRVRFGHIERAEDLLNSDGQRGLRLWPPNTILFPKSGASTFLNHRVMMDVEACVASHLATIVAKPDRVLPAYLLYFLHTIRAQDLTQDHNYPSLRLPEIGAIKVPLPPLVEQKRIVAILDEAFEGIAKATANAERNLANSEELFESQLQAIFDQQKGREYTLSDICSIESKLIDPREAEFADMLHIGAGNMVTKSDALIDLKTAKEEGLISGKFLFDADTILYSKIRPYLMKVARPDFVGLCSADVYPLKPRKAVLDRNYLFFLLLSWKFTKYAIEGSGRAGMPKVNRNHLFAYRVTLPDLDTQIASAERIDLTMSARSKLSALYQTKLVSLRELKQSLLHKAFSGQLTGEEAVAV